MNLTRRLMRGSFFRLINLLLQISISFVMIPFVVHHLGNRDYGFWAMAGSFIGYYGMMDFGLVSAVVRFVSRASGKEDELGVNEVASTAFFSFAILGGVVLLISIIAALGSSLAIKSPEESLTFGIVVVITGTGVAISFPLRVFSGLLIARLRHDMQSYAAMFRLVFTNLCVFAALSMGHGIIAMAVISLVSLIAMHLIMAWMAFRAVPGLRIRYSSFSRKNVSTMFSYGGISFWARTAGILKDKTPAVLIGALLNANQVTFYHIGARLLNNFNSLVSSVTGVGAPLFSWQEARGDYDALRRSFLVFIRLSFSISTFVGASILFFGKDFIAVWMGPSYEKSFWLLVIMGAPAIVSTAQGPAGGVLYGISKHRFLAVTNTVETICGVALALILIRFWGIYGLAAAFALVNLAINLFLQPVYVCKSIDLPLAQFSRAVGVPVLKITILLGLWFALIRPYLGPSYASIFCLAGVQMVLFTPILYFYVLEAPDREALKKALKSRKRGKTAATAPAQPQAGPE